jgi:predicted outer membrane repeat protein
VKNTNDAGADSLRVVMLAAGDGDTINFDPTIANQTITLTSGVISLPETTNPTKLTVDGQTNNITVSGNNASGIFAFAVNRVLTVNNLIFVNGKDSTPFGGGAIQNVGSILDANPLTINNCKFNSNSAVGNFGGAIWSDSSTVLNSCAFTSNTSLKSGGALYLADGSTLTVTNCVFNTNSALGSGDRNYYWGGAICISVPANVTVTGTIPNGSLFQNN